MSAILPLPLTGENGSAAAYVCTTPEEGLAQLELLKSLGCKPHHKVLEIGCGALVAGYPVMQYLDPGNYVGVDPNAWLRKDSLGIAEVKAICEKKKPRFFSSVDFRAGLPDERFDFILSHSILSHASDSQLGAFFIAARMQLKPGGILAASIRLAEGNAFGSPGSEVHGAAFTEWQYPGVSWFRKVDVIERALAKGLLARVDPKCTRIITNANPKAFHDWIVARVDPAWRQVEPSERAASRRIMLGVPCFAEDRDLLLRSLRSFAEKDVDVVAVDNGAKAEAKAALEEMGDAVTVVAHPTNIYVNPAWNELAEAFLASDAEILVIANADLVVSPGWSTVLLERARSGERAIWRGRGVDTAEEASEWVLPSSEESADPRHTAGAFFAMGREAVKAAFPIPAELRIWYGDTWIDAVLSAKGFAHVTLSAIRAWHAGKVSSNRLPELGDIVAMDHDAWMKGIAAKAGTPFMWVPSASSERAPHTPPSSAAAKRVSGAVAPPCGAWSCRDARVVFVTGFFRLPDRKVDEDKAWAHFGELAASGLPIMLFIGNDVYLPAKWATRRMANVRILQGGPEDLWPFRVTRGAKLRLPSKRTRDKDTRSFLLLQNAKLDLLFRAGALDEDPAHTHFAWIDFSILKIVKDKAAFLETLRHLSPPQTCVLAPGCWEKGRKAPAGAVHWRFCGGFLLADRKSIGPLVESHHAAFEKIQKQGRITWEVNVWETMEKKGTHFDWYKADHDDSILPGRSPPAHRVGAVCLVMIVKNERAIIERCLSAALAVIDTWVITDTGSSDGTGEAIEAFFRERGIPGQLAHGEFRNFAQARNEALRNARASAIPWDYALLIDADMVIGGSVDRASLSADAYMVIQNDHNLSYWNTRLVRRDVDAQYVGATHEFLSVPGGEVPRLASLVIDDRGDGGSKDDKCERDIRLLLASLTEHPEDARSMFYLAQTYREARRNQEAIHWYARRIEAGGWDEEVWASYYGIARCHLQAGDDGAFVKACFDAYSFRPSRAEPLALLARFWRERGKSDAAILIGEEVATMPYPGDVLFVEPAVYARKSDVDVSISGFYSKRPERRQAGYDACARLTLDPDPGIRNEARANFVHYVRGSKDLFGAEIRRIDCGAEMTSGGYAPMNPSVLSDALGRLCLIRTVNYTISDGQYPTNDGSGIIRTRNWIAEMDEDWRIIRQRPVIDRTGMKRTGYPVEGFEDCRLYSVADGRMKASAVVRDLGDGRCEMAILTLEQSEREWSVVSLDVLRDYEHHRDQKNWMPILKHPGAFLYSSDPTIVIDAAPQGTVEMSRHHPCAYLRELRGGSQLITDDKGYLCLVHEVVWNPGRVYLHRFMKVSADFRIVGLTEPFYFEHKGIEFAAGLARDGDRLVASYGVNDASAHLAFFHPDSIEGRMKALASSENER